MKHIDNFIKKRRIVILGIIFLFGLFLRLYNLNNVEWFGDPSRDLLVAKHLVEYPGEKFISPWSALGQALKNSSLYYWTLALFWFFCRSEKGIVVIYSIISSSSIILAYFLSKEVLKDKYLLLLPFIISISNIYIWQSRNIWQPNLLLPLQLITFIFLFKGIKKNTYYLWSIQFAFLATLLHYSFLPLLIVLFIYIYIDLYLLKNFDLCIKVFILGLFNFIIYLFLTKSNISGLNIYFVKSLVENLKNITNNLNLLGNLYIRNINNTNLFLFYFSLISSLAYLFIKNKNKVTIILTILFASLYLTSFYNLKVNDYYLTPYYLITLIIYIYTISKLRRYKYLISFFIIIGITFIITKNSLGIVLYRKYDMNSSYNIANNIIKDSNDLTKIEVLTCREIADSCIYPTYASMGTWFHLEKISNKRLGEITDNLYENYVPYSNNNPDKKTYLICDFAINKCLKKLDKDYRVLKIIYSDDRYSLSLVELIQNKTNENII